MSDTKNNIDGFYNKIYTTYKPEDYFDEIEIKVNYYKNNVNIKYYRYH
ncbi:Uncharacterised protein [Actinobacillus pleuropneumoniae]|uniref:Uncharacterized protein n=1 Tax=Actinobacillus pleuropneumoniae TaxID=715 RepID=A0A448TZ22_ACTPL|nr:Uncharacterised protein [Actinobacillus pleuropneumoniae]